MADSGSEERRPLLGVAAGGGISHAERHYGAREVREDVAIRPSSTDGNVTIAASTSAGVQNDSVPYLPINPGRPVNQQYAADVSTSTLLESGEERFRLMRRQLAESRGSRELRQRSPPGTTSQVHVSWSRVNVYLRKKKTWKDRLGLNDDEESGADQRDGDLAYDGIWSPNGEQYSKTILKNVSGSVSPGQLLAIMGASGAGKTSLLNILAGRNAHGLDVLGSIRINGEEVSPDFICSVSGYIQQEDLFISTLTVRENLVFQALLRMPKHFAHEMRLARVEEVLQEVGLREVAGSTIGDPIRIRGISGGERKRLSFASEVLTDPPLLFVDEPTSGLDSYMAESVISTLQTLAQSGRTILSTIHQPASEIYAMFDRVMLLAEGRTAFLGTCQDALDHFHSLGHECPPNFNPADYFVHKLAIVPRKEEECRRRVKAISDAYDQSCDVAQSGAKQSELGTETLVGRQKESWFKQTSVIMKRSWLSFVRDPGLIRVRFIQTVFTAVLAGIVYLRMSNNATRVQNSAGVLFFMIVNQVFGPLFSVLQVFPLELPLFLRDVQNRMYSTNVYFICKTLAELPFNIINAAIYTSIVYWMVGLNPDLGRFGYAVAMIIMVTLCAISTSYFVSAISPTIHVAMAIAPMMIMPLLLFGGLFVNVNELPVYLKWLTSVSFINYAFEGLLINEWHDFGESFGQNGTEVIVHYGFTDSMEQAVWDLNKVVIWAVVMRILAYIALEIRVWRTTRR